MIINLNYPDTKIHLENQLTKGQSDKFNNSDIEISEELLSVSNHKYLKAESEASDKLRLWVTCYRCNNCFFTSYTYEDLTRFSAGPIDSLYWALANCISQMNREKCLDQDEKLIRDIIE